MADPFPVDPYDPPPKRARPLRTAAIVAVLAFVLGAVLVTWALTRWEPARRLLVVAPAAVAPPPRIPALPPPAVAATEVAPLPLVAAAGTEARVAGLEARIAQIDVQAAGAAANAARAEGLLVAFAARRAIDAGRPLGYLEGQLRDRFAPTQPRAVAAVIAAAQAPVTLATLRHDLDTVTPDLIGTTPGESWVDSARRSLGSLIVVRRRDDPPIAADARLARARLAIDSGQVDGALAEIARMPTRDRADAWMTAARRFVEAHRALDILEASALMVPSPLPPTPQTK